jgi:hypothetical protein
VSVLVQVEGVSMEVNPTHNLQMFPIAKISKSPYTTALQCHRGEESSEDPSEGLARPTERPVRLETGSVVDVYV